MQVNADLPRWRRSAELVGRRAECVVLDHLIGAVRSGESRALVVCGEAGVGKTALLDYVAVQARGCRVLRGGGVQSEMELPFAGLHQLCAPLLADVDRLPQPQSEALRTAFGIGVGSAPDRFMIGLAVLGLLSAAAQDQPIVCLVDDQQWLDQASAQILTFVARRLGAESVGLCIATRQVGDNLRGLPALAVRGLAPADAAAVLDAVFTGPVDTRIRDQIIAETRGNPLALLELPRGLSVGDLAGGFGLPGAMTLSDSIEDSFARRIGAIPDTARRLLLTAASDPSGDPVLLWRAAAWLGIDAEAATAAADTELVEFGTRVRFRHPLARSAVYRSASALERRQVHRALAEVSDEQLDPDRRAWHRAKAASGPDEDVAAALESSAIRAQARGGLAAAAAFLLQATKLTLDPARRAARALAAADTHVRAGALGPVLDLLTGAEAGPLAPFQRAQADLIRAQLAFVTNRGSDGPPLLLKAAKSLEPLDPGLSRATYLDALSAATVVGRLASPASELPVIAQAAAAAPPAATVRAPDLLLDGMVASFKDGYAAGLPMLRAGLAEYGARMSPQEELHWLWFATRTALRVWDDERMDVLSARHLELARDLGSLSELPLALDLRAYVLLFTGDLAGAIRLAGEAQAVEEATGAARVPYSALGVMAFRGDEADGPALHQRALLDVSQRGEGAGVTFAHWAYAVLCNSLGRHGEAFAAASNATSHDVGPVALLWPYLELVEAAMRVDETATAVRAYTRLTQATSACGTAWALGVQARSKALLSTGDEADARYRESIAQLGRTRFRVELARAHLLYGEWLRRQRRNLEAREQLDLAHTMFATMGMAAFAGRAGNELRAAGSRVRKRVDVSKHDELTAQEFQIARMARDGLSNPEIAGRLFISAYTVQYHLRKVFTKLGVSSRSQLETALGDGNTVVG